MRAWGVLWVMAVAACVEPLTIGSRSGSSGGDGGAPVVPAAWRAHDVGLSDRFASIHGTAPDDLWAVGDRGVIVHFDGNGWTRFDSDGVLDDLNDVFAISRSDVWAVGDNGALLHFDGARWAALRGVAPAESGGQAADLVSVAATSRDDVWVVPWGAVDVGQITSEHAALHFDGRSWQLLARPEPELFETDVVARSPSEAWILDDEGLQRWDGARWFNVDPPVRDTLLSFVDAWIDPEGRLWILGYESPPGRARVFRQTGPGWVELEGEALQGSLFSSDLTAIYGERSDSVWAVGELGFLVRYDGQSWKTVIPHNFTMPRLAAVFVIEGRVWAVGARGAIVRGE